MRLDHPAFDTVIQYVDVGFLRRRYNVVHIVVRRWVDDYTGEKCGEHTMLERGCLACKHAATPPVPVPDAVRNGSAPLWRLDRVDEWDDWVQGHIFRMPGKRFASTSIKVPDSGAM